MVEKQCPFLTTFHLDGLCLFRQKLIHFQINCLCSNSLQNFKFRSLYKKETNNEQQKELKEKDQH